MTLQQLRAFLAVVEEGSFRAAARRLGLSQAGLTTSVQALEQALGQTLLQRSARGVMLTDAGRRLQARAQAIEREVQRALEEAREMQNVAGTLNVGAGPTPTALLLPKVVPDFHARFPHVRLRLVAGLHERLRPALQQGLLDLALVAMPDEQPWPGLKRSLLFRAKLTVVGRPGHPLAGARSLGELQGATWILMGSPGGPGGTVTRFFADHGLPPPPVAVTCEDFTEVAALMAATDWLALLPLEIVRRGLIGPALQIIPIREQAHRFENCLVQRLEPAPTPAAAAFAAMCQSWARVLAGRSPVR